MSIEMRIEGAAKLEKKLTRMPKKVAKKVVTQSLRKGAAIIRKKTKQLAPFDTRTMRKSIVTRAAPRKRAFPGVKALLQLFNVKKYGQLITNKDKPNRGFYPAAVEYGRAAKGNPRGPKVTRPQSFVRQGFHASKRKAEAAIMKALSIGIKEQWRKN